MIKLSAVRRLVVVSPHLDDAALSLGATLAQLAAAGASVTVLTVLAGDPQSETPAGPWDRASGFATAGHAARARREEDLRACGRLGVEAEWLPFADAQYRTATDADAIWTAMRPLLHGADLVLIPGHPLTNPDHAWLSEMLMAHADEAPFALYVEQPYASDLAIGRQRSVRPIIAAISLLVQTRLGSRPDPRLPDVGDQHRRQPVRWESFDAGREARAAKRASITAYTSQLGPFGRSLLHCVALYEAIVGGERVGYLEP
jgi:LmbE family N-acetylglucosaminyl deacetylase